MSLGIVISVSHRRNIGLAKKGPVKPVRLKAVTIWFDQDEEDLSERQVQFPRNGNIILKSWSGWSENIIWTGNQLWFSTTIFLIVRAEIQLRACKTIAYSKHGWPWYDGSSLKDRSNLVLKYDLRLSTKKHHHIALGHDGATWVANETGMSPTTICEGKTELPGQKIVPKVENIRRPGGGRAPNRSTDKNS